MKKLIDWIKNNYAEIIAYISFIILINLRSASKERSLLIMDYSFCLLEIQEMPCKEEINNSRAKGYETHLKGKTG